MMKRKKPPKFESHPNSYPIMLCPQCDGNYLHHLTVEVFSRSREDSEEGLHILVEGNTFRANTDMIGNPSGRRNGLKIGFSCETCEFKTEMIIQQHKGQTFVHTEFIPNMPREVEADAEFPFA